MIKLPDGKRTSIKDILENGDIALENGLELTPDGYALSGDFAGKRIIAPEEAGDAPQKNAGQSEDAPEKKAASESAQSESKIETIAEIVTSMPAMMKAAQSGGKKQGEAKKTGPKNVASGNSKAKKAMAKKSEPNAQNRRLYIPPEDAKKRSVAFMNGCWKGGSVDYSTKRKVTICFCFRNSKGTGKIYDPGFFGTTSAPALAKILLMGSFGLP